MYIQIRLLNICSLICDLHCPLICKIKNRYEFGTSAHITCHSHNIFHTIKRYDINIKLYAVKWELYVFAKSIDPRQPAQFAQADMGRDFSLSLNFLDIKGSFFFMTHSAVSLWIHNFGNTLLGIMDNGDVLTPFCQSNTSLTIYTCYNVIDIFFSWPTTDIFRTKKMI